MRFQVAVLLPLFVSLGFAADPALTVYNRQFAVVRETIALDLKQGLNQIQFTGTTAQLEPESVMLRDPTGQRLLRILEQNYRADPVSLEALMQRYEGQTIDFEGRVRPRERRQGRSPLRPRRVFDDADFHGLFFVISALFLSLEYLGNHHQLHAVQQNRCPDHRVPRAAPAR